jgi:hypothetical protein
MGFYSTLPSSSLLDRLKQLQSSFEWQIIDNVNIEGALLSSDGGIAIGRRHLPASMRSWIQEHPKPPEMFKSAHVLCDRCGRDLLNPPQGIFCLWWKISQESGMKEYIDFYCSCKGRCDDIMSALIEGRHGDDVYESWQDIDDFTIPILYLKVFESHMTRLQRGGKWTDEVFERFITFLISVFPLVARHPTSSESKRLEELREIPSFMGGVSF